MPLMASLRPGPRTTTPQRCSVAYRTLTACCGYDGSRSPAHVTTQHGDNRVQHRSCRLRCVTAHSLDLRQAIQLRHDQEQHAAAAVPGQSAAEEHACPPSRSAHMRGPKSSNRRSARRAVTMPLAGSAHSRGPLRNRGAEVDGGDSNVVPFANALLSTWKACSQSTGRSLSPHLQSVWP